MAVAVLLNRETDVVLRDGSILHVRPASPADEASVVVGTPPWILSIGEFYEDFAQTSDEGVVSLLERAAARPERIAVVPEAVAVSG